MTKPIIKEINVQSGAEIEREMTDQELIQYEIDTATFEQLKKTETERATLRAEVLNKLGLTSDEVAALLG